MAMTFYPHEDQIRASDSIETRLEQLLKAAELYKSVILDPGHAHQQQLASTTTAAGERKTLAPKDLISAYHWEEVAKLLRQIRELPEASPSGRLVKANSLNKLAEIYEVLRGAKMAKLEAIRLALVNEATQLRSNTAL